MNPVQSGRPSLGRMRPGGALSPGKPTLCDHYQPGNDTSPPVGLSRPTIPGQPWPTSKARWIGKLAVSAAAAAVAGSMATQGGIVGGMLAFTGGSVLGALGGALAAIVLELKTMKEANSSEEKEKLISRVADFKMPLGLVKGALLGGLAGFALGWGGGPAGVVLSATGMALMVGLPSSGRG